MVKEKGAKLRIRLRGGTSQRITEIEGVSIPERIQTSPIKALAYAQGYLFGSGQDKDRLSLIEKSLRITQQDLKNYDEIVTREFESGYYTICRKMGKTIPSQVCQMPRGGFVKRDIDPHELRLDQLMERAHRNPSFIPHWACPCYAEDPKSLSKRAN